MEKKRIKNKLVGFVLSILIFSLLGNWAFAAEKETVIAHFKQNLAKDLDALAEEYNRTHPGANVAFDNVGTGNFQTTITQRFAAGVPPDAWLNQGDRKMDVFIDQLEDLSDQPWVKYAYPSSLSPLTRDGKVYGWPMNIEGYGLIYNKEIFKKAGIEKLPKSLSELRVVAEKIKKAGYIPFANAGKEWWVLRHTFNTAIAHTPNPEQFLADLSSGKATFKDNKVFKDWFNYLDLSLEFGQKNPLTTSYQVQERLVALGQAAMMQQGNWAVAATSKMNPDAELGLLHLPLSDKNSSIYAGLPSGVVVNKDSPQKERVKDFLNWWVMSEFGQKFMIEKLGFIPAYKHIEVPEGGLDPVGTAVMNYAKAGETKGWYWSKMSPGLVRQVAADIQAYIAGVTTADETLDAFQEAWEKFERKN